MKKIFFIALLFQTVLSSQLQASFLELNNDTQGTVEVEVQFNPISSFENYRFIKQTLRRGQQRLKIHQPGCCNNGSISFTTTDDNGVQRRATLFFTGSAFDPGITTFNNSSSAYYWFSIKAPDWGGYEIKILEPSKKSVNSKLREQGFTSSTFSGEKALLKKGKFVLQ